MADEITVDFVLSHPKTFPLIEQAWWNCYSSERKMNHYPTASQASSAADIDLAGQLGMSLQDVELLRASGLKLKS